jgi:Fe-S cluster biogenesis protein NfuA
LKPTTKQACKGCGSTSRKLLYPGPRCTTCWRAFKATRKATRQDQYQRKTFGITKEEGDLIIEFQGGGCICAPWTGYRGQTRALSTDHDHATGVIRGKLCKHCNDLLGRIRDNIEFFRRMMAYLENPPAVRLLGERVVPGHGE